MKVDIIGGGIAGLSTAISLKKLNKIINVSLHEKNQEIGYNRQARQCGEAHSVQNEWSKWKLTRNCYFTKTNSAEVIVGKKKYTGTLDSGDGFILNRPEFINQLGKKAQKLGVKINTNNKIKSFNELNGEIIIDASGCPSSIKRELGLLNNKYGIGYQETLINSNSYDSKTLKFEFIPEKGYFWIFPRNPKINEINIGLGIFSNKKYDLKKMLSNYKKNNSIKGDIDFSIGGYIPIGLQPPYKYKNILFVGDAGVGTFPFQGQGIYRALLSGEIAATCIAKNIINKYPYFIRKAFIKWDIIGRNYWFFCDTLEHINKELTLSLLNLFLKFFKGTVITKI